MSDLILRYCVNPIAISDIKYAVIALLFDACWIFGIVHLCYSLLPETLGKVLYTLVYLTLNILALVNYIYFRLFGQFMWLKAIGLASEGFDYINQVLGYFSIGVILIILLYILILVVTLILWQKPVYKRKSSALLLTVLPFALLFAIEGFVKFDTNRQIKKGAWEIWDRPVLVYKHFTDASKSMNVCGFYQFTAKSLYKLVFDTTSYDTETANECTSFFENNRYVSDNQMTGVLKDKNVIFVLMESIDDWLITEKYTPTIKYMMDNGINFKNHYMPNVGSGYTFNSEFSMNTGFICPSNISSASVFTSNTFSEAMPSLFKRAGYNTNSFHFNGKNFYNRRNMHKAFGYNEYFCLMDYMPIEKCVQDSEVPLVDKIYDNMTKDKFFSFYISYSCHLPYDVVDNKLKGALEKYPNLIDNTLDEETRNACLLAHDTDEFFRLLIERLKADGLYEDTVIIGVADHYSYGIKDTQKLEQYSIDAGSSIREKVPFFIYSPTLSPVEVTKVTGAIDIVPTILNMFALNTDYYIGNDAFNPDYDGFVYFPNGSWYDGKLRYVHGEKVEYTSDEQQYIDNMNKKIIHLNKINDFVINSDYFKNLKTSGN